MYKLQLLHPPGRIARLLSLAFFFFLAFGQIPLQAANRTAATLGGQAYTLPDGNFETPALPTSPGYQYSPSGSNWTFANNAGYSRNGSPFTSGNPNAPQGNQVLFLQGTGRISQSIAFTAGTYTFHLKIAQRGNHQSSSQTLELRIDGTVIQDFSPSGTSYQSFTSVQVDLSSGNHTVELRGLNPNGGDNTAFVDEFQATRLNQIQLSGFESPVLPSSPGFQYAPSGGPWTFSSGGGISRNGTGFTVANPNAPEGDQVLFLQGGGSASLPLTIAQAGYYRFRFKAALRGNNLQDGEVKNIRITLGSTEVGEVSLPSSDYTEQVSLAIYLSAGSHTLTLKGVNPVAGDHTGLVDDLRMEMLHDWQDATVWDGTLPGSNDIATVPEGSAVVMRGTIAANRIVVNGELIAAQNRDLTITAKNILISGSEARFELGQELAPYPMNATITLNASTSDATIGHFGQKFLAADMGGTLQMHGEEKISWSQLGANVSSGATQITMKEDVNWEVGDEILIVSSRKSWNEWERRSITAKNGSALTLDAALSYPHVGVVKTYSDGSRTWTADLRAEVGLLSHNILIQGDAASDTDGFGGHIMLHHDAYGYVSGVELYRMGQKAILARYPFHWHLVKGQGADQFFKNSSVHKSFNRAITIHGTDYTTVENNFFFDHIGHGVFLEDGGERFNTIRKNVCLLSKRPAEGEELTPSDNQFNQVQNRTPSSYWITNPQNTFEDNVAAGTHGTGFWFAFPQSPMGPSGQDPYFSGLQPHTLPMISFKGNSAHSCMTGFDIFDQLDQNHSILTNKGWAESSQHLMENCLWYANDLALYTGIGAGGPSDNLIFENNVFVDNKVGTMFASYSITDNSVFVANSGENTYSGQRYAYRVYDGAGQVHNSHFIGWNASNSSFLLNTGAATKHTNHILTGNTTDHTGLVRCVLPDFDVPPGYAGANDPEHPRFWSIVLRDEDGGITGKANTSMLCNHPFVLVGDEFQATNWTRTYRSDRHYALNLLSYGLPASQIPNMTATREKAGTETESVYYIDGFKEHHQLPFIVNDGFQYTYTYESLPSSKAVYMRMDDATAGDNYLVRFKDFGKLGGLNLSSSQGSYTAHTSLASLNASSTSGYYVRSGGDVYIKPVATGKSQTFYLTWTTDFTVPTLDTDGDEVSDAEEVADANRHPYEACDLEADFDVTGDFESWTTFSNISGATVSGGMLKGTSINNGDAMILNDAFNFQASEVDEIQVRMKASTTTGVQIFFATSSAPGYSGSRVVSASYTGGGAFQTLSFDVGGHASWTDVITDLRFDVVSGVGISFEVDWFKSTCSSSKNSGIGQESLIGQTSSVAVFPNPMRDQLHIEFAHSSTPQYCRLIDLQGRVLKSERPSPGSNRLDWDLSGLSLSSGIYFLQIVGTEGTESVKITKE